MNKNESPLSVAEQIEILEAAKVELVASSDRYYCIGLCDAISRVIHKNYKHLLVLASRSGIYKVIPSFTFENAVIFGTNYRSARPDGYWWSSQVEKGGITNRLNFLDFLIEKLKNEYYEKND